MSKIECDKATPSLRTLHRIVRVLDTSIASLFGETAADEVTVYRGGARPEIIINAQDGADPIRLERVTPFVDGQSLEGNVHVVSQGADSGGAISHQGEEVGYVLEGELELTVASTTYYLAPGDSFYFRSELPHSYRNIGSGTARILWVNAPPTF